jgi:hypothetical protein
MVDTTDVNKAEHEVQPQWSWTRTKGQTRKMKQQGSRKKNYHKASQTE